MPRYELDDYVREHGAGDAASANCVVSWRAHSDADGRAVSPIVSLHNSWRFDSRHWNGRGLSNPALRLLLPRDIPLS